MLNYHTLHHSIPRFHLWVLLLDVGLSTTLLGLANVVLLLSLSRSLTIASQASNSSTDSTSSAVRNASAEVSDLSLSLLLLALCVLLLTSILEILGADKTTNSLLGRADGFCIS